MFNFTATEEKIRFVAVIGLDKIGDLRAAGVIDTDMSRDLKDTYNTFSTVNGLVLHTQWMDGTEYSDIRITNSDAEFFADWIAYDYCQKKEMTVHEFLLNYYEKGSAEMQAVVENLIWRAKMARLFKKPVTIHKRPL